MSVLICAATHAPWSLDVADWALELGLESTIAQSVADANELVAIDTRIAVLDLTLEGVPELARSLADAGLAILLVGDTGGRTWRSKSERVVHEPVPTRAQFESLVRAVSATTSPTTRIEDGLLIAVTGAGGSGSSITAAAIAAGLADQGHDVVLVDGCRRGVQAMLHQLDPQADGILELVLASVEQPAAVVGMVDQVAQHATTINGKTFRVVIGTRNPAQWTQMPADRLDIFFKAVRKAADIVVIDVDPETMGATETGSFDLDDRHGVTRRALGQAERACVVVRADLTGIAAGKALIDDLGEFDERLDILPVLVHPRRVRRAAKRAAFDLIGHVRRPVSLPSVDVDGDLASGHGLRSKLTSTASTVAMKAISPRAASLPLDDEPVALDPGDLDDLMLDDEVAA